MADVLQFPIREVEPGDLVQVQYLCTECMHEWWETTTPPFNHESWFTCPKCGNEDGQYNGRLLPKVEGIWQCNCGSLLTIVSSDINFYCAGCGVKAGIAGVNT